MARIRIKIFISYELKQTGAQYIDISILKRYLIDLCGEVFDQEMIFIEFDEVFDQRIRFNGRQTSLVNEF